MFFQLHSQHTPPNLQGSLLVDEKGLPRYWASIWSIFMTGQLAESTHTKKLRFIEDLYRHADQSFGPAALDDALGSSNDDLLASILESWFVALRNQPSNTEADQKRWDAGLTFVSSVLGWISKSDANPQRQNIEVRLHRLSTLYRQFHVHRRRSVETIRSLPASTVEALYQIVDPESQLNPFPRERTRWRIYIAFLLMLHQGLRRGEVLLLPADAVKSGFDRKANRNRLWLNVQENPYEDAAKDPRYSKPGIKTAASYRQIPISEAIAGVIDMYVQNFRGRPKHSFLLNSQSDLPLSTEAITKAFAQISSKLPKPVLTELKNRTGKVSVTPHDLRHTCAVMRLHQLLAKSDPMDEALQKLRTFFGWSKTSAMASHYARAVFEDRLATVWNSAFDDRVALLRALPKEQ